MSLLIGVGLVDAACTASTVIVTIAPITTRSINVAPAIARLVRARNALRIGCSGGVNAGACQSGSTSLYPGGAQSPEPERGGGAGTVDVWRASTETIAPPHSSHEKRSSFGAGDPQCTHTR